MKFLIDMNLSPQWREFLSSAGLDVEHWSTIGAPDASDVDILDLASRDGWVIITQDLDFGTLLALRGLDLPSVIQVRAQATLPGDVGKRILDAISASERYIRRGALITVTPADHRVSILPLRPSEPD
jgi:predicted nuclease of predicted toxin-antitoxin system